MAEAPAVKEEAELMGRYCDGDARAFERLYALLAPRILAYLVGLTGDRALGEDLLQQTFLKLHRSRSSYVRDANPVPWMYAIAHRTCLDELRKRGSSRVKLTADGTLPSEPRATISGSPDESGGGSGAPAGSEDGAAERISLADLDGLPHNQKEALILTKVHGHTLAEAAAITGSTPGAIKLRAHRAYVTLRARLGLRSPAAAKGATASAAASADQEGGS